MDYRRRLWLLKGDCAAAAAAAVAVAATAVISRRVYIGQGNR